MSEQDWSTKLAPVLSVLDSIRPNAAEALREMIAKDHNALRNEDYEAKSLFDAVMSHIHWGSTPQDHDFWCGVHYDLAEYENTWFS